MMGSNSSLDQQRLLEITESLVGISKEPNCLVKDLHEKIARGNSAEESIKSWIEHNVRYKYESPLVQIPATFLIVTKFTS